MATMSHRTPKDQWSYKGHSIVYDPHGNKKLYIDDEEIEPSELGSMVYSRTAIREYIDEEYERTIGSGTIDEYPGDDK